MDEAILKTLTPATRKVIEAVAGTPGDCVHFYNRLSTLRGGIKIGAEVMAFNLLAKKEVIRKKMAEMPTQMSLGEMSEVNMLEQGLNSALAVGLALECAMNLLEAVHGKDVFKASMTTAARKVLDEQEVTKRILAGETHEQIAESLGATVDDVKRATRLRKLDLE